MKTRTQSDIELVSVPPPKNGLASNGLKKKSRTFLESAPDATIIINRSGRIALVNSQTERLFGYRRKELLGRDFETLIPQVQRKLTANRNTNFFADPKTCRLEASSKLHGVRKNGKKFSLDMSLSPLQVGKEVYSWAAVRDITEWQQIEDDSKITQAYTRSLIEASLDPLITISPAGKITDVNEASVKLTGVPREKLIGTDFSDYFTEPKKAREGYKRVFDFGSVSDYPLTVRKRGGGLVDVLYNASVYRDKLGNVLGVFAAARDVTAQEQASQYARSLIEASLDPLVTVSPDGKITDVNEASVKLTGVPRVRLIGTDFSDYFTEPKKAREVYEEVFDKGFVSDYPLTVRRHGGELVDVLYNASVYKDKLGNVLGVSAAARDVTAQKQASQYARSLIEASLDPLVTISPEGKITDVNEALVKATGVPREKIIGTDFSDYFTEPVKAREGYQQVFAKGFVADSPLTLRHKNGKLTDVLYNATVYKDDLGNVLGMLATARDITQVKRTSQYARSLIEASLDPLVTINPEGKITDVNEALVKATGVKREKLIGTDFSDYFTEPEKAQQGYQEVFAKGFVANSPLTLRHKKGKLTDVLYNATVYKDDAGNVLGMLATARDITAIKEAEEKIRKIQAYTRSLIETSLDPQIIKGPDGKISDVNEATVRATGVPREKIIGTHFPDYFTEPEKAEEAYQQAFKGAVSNYPLAIRHVSGKITDVLYNAAVFKDEEGVVQGVFASARDITDRKQVEEEIRKREAYTRSLIEASLDPLVTISPGGKITDVNEALVNATGVSREKIIGTDFSDYFTEPEKAREGYKQVFAKGFVADSPLTLRHRKGKLTDVLYNATVYKDDQGNVLGMLATARDITQLKRSSQYARSLIEASLDPLVTISPEGKITDVNEALVRATGVPREKIIGTDFSDYFTEPEKAREGYKQVFAKGFVADSPLTLRHRNGKLTDVLYNATVYKDDLGNVLGMLATARDITQVKRTSQYARSLIEASLDPLVTISPEGKITDVNEALVKATGVTREKVIGSDFSDYFTEPDKAREGYKQVFAQGFVADSPLTLRHKNGKLTDVLYNATVYKDDAGNVLGMLATARDITQVKQTSEYARSLIEASLDPLVTISPEGKITDVNEALVKATGVPRERIIGTDFSDYFTEPQKAQEGYQQVFAKGFVANSPLTLRHREGKLTDVLYNATVYKDGLGNVLGMLATARDITAQRKQEIKIKTLNEELEQRIIELESFSYSVSHDLRAPLRGIDGFIAIFLSKYLQKVDSEGQRLLGNVSRNVNKMGSLIDELLTLSRIGMKDIQIVTIDMTELVNTVLEELSEMKGKSKVAVKKLSTAKGDIALIKQVLVNLISNAFKYSNKRELPQIEIGSIATENEMQFYIKDNGVGFDMEYSNKLFGVFQRLHDPQEYQGTGVGLAIVKRIIIRHGGRVWAKGKEDEGATFYFSLKPY